MIRYLLQAEKNDNNYDYFIIECNNLSELYNQLQIKYGSMWQKPRIEIVGSESYTFNPNITTYSIPITSHTPGYNTVSSGNCS